jgi:hypothetical protein
VTQIVTPENVWALNVARNIRRESTVILLRYIEEDVRDLRNRIETGKAIPNDLTAATRIRIYANELAERGL